MQDLDYFATDSTTKGFTGADLRNEINEAALVFVARSGRTSINEYKCRCIMTIIVSGFYVHPYFRPVEVFPRSCLYPQARESLHTLLSHCWY